MTVADRIRNIRLENDLSQNKFAIELEVSQCQVWQWEHGVYKPTWETMKKICERFYISPNELMGYDDGKFV